MKRSIALPLAAALALGATSPAFADAFKPSQSQQIELGQRAADELRHKEKVLPSSDPRVRLVRRVGRRLLDTIQDKESWEYSFDVIQSPEVNAFSLPGGPTFIYTGLLDKLKTEDELAGVMGHELTHVRKEHWAYGYRDSQKRNLLLNLGLIVLHANDAAANLAGVTNDLVFELPFSRKHESEADMGGFDMMVAAGYNPKGMVDVFAMLRDEAKTGKVPEFFSDHPDDGNRIKKIQSRIDASNQAFPAERPIGI